MIYLANPSTQAIRDAMLANPYLGFIDTPKQGNKKIRGKGVVWCADNGCYGKGYPGDAAWLEWLARLKQRELCLFATAPDVVGDFEATRVRSQPFLEQIRTLGYPAALVAQDGMEWTTWDPWDEIDALFIGGTDRFKLSAEVANIVALASSLGKWVHMGRVNSARRFRYAREIGCDSVDGTFLAFGPDANLPRLMRWLTFNDQHLFDFDLLEGLA